MRSKRVILIDEAGLHRARRKIERERERERKETRAKRWRARKRGTRGRVVLDGGIREGVVARGS